MAKSRHSFRLPWHKCLPLLLTFIVSLYLLGFAIYVALLPKPFTTIPEHIDGLVALTGGAGRVEAAFTAIENGFVKPILISGSHPQTRLVDILSKTGTKLNLAQRQMITLDLASTTHQNIISLKQWATEHNLHRLGVITSTYHAARVEFLGWWEAPELSLNILPVQPEGAGFTTLIHEYHKLLVAPLLK